MDIINIKELSGAELRERAEKLIRVYSQCAAQEPELVVHYQQLMDKDLSELLAEINDRGRAIAKKYKKTFRPLDLRGIKADMDAILGRGGLQ